MSNGKIEYHGKQLTLRAIAQKEGLVQVTLARYYKNIGDIYLAVSLCKQNSKGKVEKIEYYGENLAISAIAKKEKIKIEKLTKVYKRIGNIYDAVKECKERPKHINEELEAKKVEYKNERLELKEIAKIEGLDTRDLRRCFEFLGDIYKAVFMAKYQMREAKTVDMEGVKLNLYDLSLLIGVKNSVLNNLLNQGMTISQIKEIYPCENAGENITLPNGETLLEYSVKNKVNFTFLYRSTQTYKKTPEVAKAAFELDEKNIPANWIYDRYMQDFNEMEVIGVPTVAMVHNLMKKQISLEELLEENILRINAEKNGIPVEWEKILYSIIETRQIIGEEYQSEICFNEKEKDFIQACQAELKLQGSTNPNDNKPKEQDDITH